MRRFFQDNAGFLVIIFAAKGKMTTQWHGDFVMRLIANRRHFLRNSLAIALFPFGQSAVQAATRDHTLFPRPFVGSQTVSSFAEWLCCDESVPSSLENAIDAELARPVVSRDTLARERERAEFLALFVSRCIAPRHLRRAGYDAAAAECAAQTDLWNGGSAAAGAQHTIGRDDRGKAGMTPLASIAYGCAAHAATACSYANANDIRTVLDTGQFVAWSILSPIFGEDDECITDMAEALWAWGAAVHAINMAMIIDQGETAFM